MKLITLTILKFNKLVVVNPEKIVYFTPMDKGSRIVFDEYHEGFFDLEVSETVEQIVDAIGHTVIV